MSVKKKPVICLMGPTASGKTQLAIALIQKLASDIISVDSALVYRGMDIGTAKPTPAELAIAPHRLIDICDPAQNYSAGQFRKDALYEIANIHQQDRIPLLVGGTMLYYHVLQHGLASLPTANPEIRAEISAQAEREGWNAIHQHLSKIDPQTAARIHANDAQRLQRALEVYLLTGQTLTELTKANLNETDFHWINIIVAPVNRTLLQERIAVRFKKMLAIGFIEEVAELMQRPDIHPDLPSMRAVGYRQVWDYLAGKLNYNEMTEQGIIATRQLAKRQFTWLRRWQDSAWFDTEEKNLVDKVLKFIN